MSGDAREVGPEALRALLAEHDPAFRDRHAGSLLDQLDHAEIVKLGDAARTLGNLCVYAARRKARGSC